VKLETIPDTNFFWTPLGKSYSCWEAEDQGPLKLFNVAADEVSAKYASRKIQGPSNRPSYFTPTHQTISYAFLHLYLITYIVVR
jgi:hypothetical protein